MMLNLYLIKFDGLCSLCTVELVRSLSDVIPIGYSLAIRFYYTLSVLCYYSSCVSHARYPVVLCVVGTVRVRAHSRLCGVCVWTV